MKQHKSCANNKFPFSHRS